MKTGKVTLLTAIFIAMAFTFSCSSDDDGGGEIGTDSSSSVTETGNGSSSSVGDGRSSSSVGASSSSTDTQGGGSHFNPDITYGSFIDSRDSKTYRTVAIGDQTWMAENLNYNADGSKCYGEDGYVVEFNDDEPIVVTLSNAEVQANCATYGRLYYWAMAMDLDLSCNKSECASQVQTKHRGICPQGWHIPSNAEWHKLYEFAEEGECSYNDGDWGRCPTAGKHLKAKSGWNDVECDEEMMNDGDCDAIGTYSGNGKDTYGFSALPGGLGDDDDDYYFALIGNNGSWWSSTEGSSDGGAYLQSTSYNIERMYWVRHNKSEFYSVRCVKD